MILINNVILEQLWVNSKVLLSENLWFSSFKAIISEGIKWYSKAACRKVSFSFVTKPCTHFEGIFIKSILFKMVCVRQWLMLGNYQNIITYSMSYRLKSMKIYIQKNYFMNLRICSAKLQNLEINVSRSSGILTLKYGWYQEIVSR